MVSKMHRQKCLFHAIKIGNSDTAANSLSALFTPVHRLHRIEASCTHGSKGLNDLRNALFLYTCMVIADGSKSSSYGNKYLKNNDFQFTIHKKGPIKRVTSKCKIAYIVVLIDFKYKVAMASESCQ